MIATHEIGRIDGLVKTVNIQFSISDHPWMFEILRLDKQLRDETRSESVARSQKVDGEELFRSNGIDLSMLPLDLEESSLQLVKFTTEKRVDRCRNSQYYTMVRFVFVPEGRREDRWPELEASVPQIKSIISNFCAESLWKGQGYDNPSGDEEDEMRFISLNFEFPGPREKALKDSDGQPTGEVRQLARARLSIDKSGLVSVEPI